MRRLLWYAVFIFACGLLMAAPPAPRAVAVPAEDKPKLPKEQTFELKDGDRVVLLGNTFVERAQLYGYIETALTIRWPDRKIIFRNLGWSGDTVLGEARARFGNQKEGYDHLIRHVVALKPTVILVSYGHNAAFAGDNGLKQFIDGYNRLLDDLSKTGARIVLISPYAHEKLGAPLPDPAAINANLAVYTQAIEKLARKREMAFFNLFEELSPCRQCVASNAADGGGTTAKLEYHNFNLTDNGMHLTRLGYWHAANTLLYRVEPREQMWTVRFDGNKLRHFIGTTVADLKIAGDTIRFTSTDPRLLMPTVPVKPPKGKLVRFTGDRLWTRRRFVVIDNAKPGRYEVRIDGKVYATAQSRKLSNGTHELRVALPRCPEFEQAEKLRQVIVKKNELYFYRWRPANETYLYLFRKHEQGQNAKEIPLFDPLVEAKEKEIAKLRKPVPHKYEIVRVKGGPR